MRAIVFFSLFRMVNYNLSHLTQDDKQDVIGPIQDDEALFMYSIIRGMRMRRVLEIGGLSGYSARNFLAAVCDDGVVYTVDYNPVPQVAQNHRVLVKNACDVTMADVDNAPLDMVFFDCHDHVQMHIYQRFVEQGLITDKTVLALHDTNLHYSPWSTLGYALASSEDGGKVHQPVERHMVNLFKQMGYDIFSIKTDSTKHGPDFPWRHGLTVCQKFTPMGI